MASRAQRGHWSGMWGSGRGGCGWQMAACCTLGGSRWRLARLLLLLVLLLVPPPPPLPPSHCLV